jgi:signal transduction histidine kinase
MITETLRRVPLFAGLTEEQHQYVQQGNEIRSRPGEYVKRAGDPPDGFYIVIEGQIEWTSRVAQQDVYVMTLSDGEFWGHELLLTDKPYPVSGRALNEARLYKLETDAFWRMLSGCPSILRRLVALLVERWGSLGTVEQQHARLASLGKLAAGLAHELNNPAAASRRMIGGLRLSLVGTQALESKLGESGLISSRYLAEIGTEVRERARTTPALDALQQNDREEEVALWLEERGFEDAWQVAPALAAAGLDASWLDSLEARTPDGALWELLLWIEESLTTRELLDQLEIGIERISNLVEAVKQYSYMDQAPLQEIDVHDGLEDTLTVLSHKLKSAEIALIREYDESLPQVSAYGSELNQVWTNLIDNAIDAVDGSGRIWIRTSQEPGRLLVEIADDGPGVPEEVQPHVFEPFFTTKDVGEGTGLGLDIARRIVAGNHKGDIRVLSRPGETRFQVRLPM